MASFAPTRPCTPLARAAPADGYTRAARVFAAPCSSTGLAFACEHNKEALDGASLASRNGAFTAALLAHLDAPVHVDTMLIRVTKAVMAATDGVQTPWHNHSLREENVCMF
jgi:hypothetical protein